MFNRTNILLALLLFSCVADAGDQAKSDQQADATTGSVEPQNSQPGLHVQFSLNRPDGGRYRRPYVAVWLEDSESYPVKTGLLWLQTENPGPRWHRDLTRWYRKDRLRKIAERIDLIDGISGATRGPGDYNVHFAGEDNSGKPLTPGKYTLCLEVAREHGTYQIIKHEMELGDEPIAPFSIPGNVEMSALLVSYVPVLESGQ